jgi:RecB family exonuclease
MVKQKFSRSPSFCFSRGANNGFKKESKETEITDGIKGYLPDHFSFSQLASFNNCPLQYKFSHIVRIPSKGRPNFSFGKTIHNTLHHFTKLASKGKNIEQESLFGKGVANIPTLDDLLDIYKKEWIDEWYDETLKKEYFEKGKEHLKKFYEDFVKTNPNILNINNEPALEKVFELKLNGDAFVGAIDRIDEINKREVEIIDYKTGGPKTSLGTDEKLQLLIYQLAASKIFNLNATKLTYHYLEDGSTCSFTPKPEETEKTEEKIREVIKRIKRSNFKPTPGWHCQYCDYRNICPHRKSGV